MSLFLHKCRSTKGSLAAEAALSLPLFLFCMLSIIFLLENICFSEKLGASLARQAKLLSAAAAAKGLTGGKEDAALGLAAFKIASVAAGKAAVVSELGSGYIKGTGVQGGASGMNFIYSSVLEKDQMIDLVAVYRVKPLFSLSGSLTLVGRARVRAFTGYDNTKRRDLADEETVFITDAGKVYHRYRECRHLAVTIRQTTPLHVGKERNSGGAKYYPCGKCGSAGAGILYITDEGNKYHGSLACPGLKRSIKAVPLSKAAGRPPCKDCG